MDTLKQNTCNWDNFFPHWKYIYIQLNAFGHALFVQHYKYIVVKYLHREVNRTERLSIIAFKTHKRM